jgi:hypothetical protein
MGSKSQKAPDYTGAAEATAEGNQEALRYQTDANRANQITPWGNLTWHGKPGDANYGQEISLSPNQQSIFNSQEQIQSQRQQNALGLGDRVQQEMNRPEDFYNNLPDVAGTPDVPTYGEGLTQFGQGGQQSTVQGRQNAEYQNLGQFGQGGQQSTVQGQPNAEYQNLGQFGQSGQQSTVQGRQNAGYQNLGQFGQSGQESQVQQMQGSQYDPRFAQQAFDRQVSLIRPTHADQQERQEVQLRNQGLTPGTQAYDTALGNLRAQQGEEMNALSADAVDRGRSEQQAEFQRSMQAGNQRFGQENTRFGQQMQQGNMYDSQRQQRAAEQGAQFQRELQAGNQQFGQENTRFAQQMQQGDMYDSQRQQQAAEQAAQFQRQLQAGSQQFGQEGTRFQQQMQQGDMYDSQRQQQAAEQAAQFQRQLQAGSQQFGQENTRFQQQMQQGSMYDQQRRQQAAEQAQFGSMGFSQQLAQQNQQNQLRQQAIAEQQGREVSALNLQNAAQSGQQVSMPQMPSYNQAGYVGGPDYLGAAQMQGTFDTQNKQPSIWETGGNLGAAYFTGGGSLLAGGGI